MSCFTTMRPMGRPLARPMSWAPMRLLDKTSGRTSSESGATSWLRVKGRMVKAGQSLRDLSSIEVSTSHCGHANRQYRLWDTFCKNPHLDYRSTRPSSFRFSKPTLLPCSPPTRLSRTLYPSFPISPHYPLQRPTACHRAKRFIHLPPRASRLAKLSSLAIAQAEPRIKSSKKCAQIRVC
jgi:hypothetical protein